jgi:choline dehydrogenase
MKSVLGDRRIYGSSGNVAVMFYKSTAATNNEFDIALSCAIRNISGYFPGYSVNATARHD